MQDIVDLCEGILHRVVSVDGKIVVVVQVVGCYGLRYILIYLQTLFDSLVVVVGTTARLAAVQQTLDNLLFKPYQNGSKTPENQGFPGFSYTQTG